MAAQTADSQVISDVVLNVTREAGVGVNLSLHPLPILNISEHLTRTRVQQQRDDVQVYGVLLGTQNGRDIDVQNSFELKMNPSNAPDAPPSITVDHDFLQTRQGLYKQVFPTLDLLGWYSVGLVPTTGDMRINEQLVQYTEAPLFLQFSPTNQRISESMSNGDLPLSMYETVVEMAKEETKMFFVPTGYRIDTGEAERIAVDHASKQAGQGGEDVTSGLLATLETSQHAIRMLSDRIKAVKGYVEKVHDSVPEGKSLAALSAEAPAGSVDHEALRQISVLCASLVPAREAKQLNEELMNEYHDVLLTNQLSLLTEGANSLNELVDKFEFATHADKREGMPGFPGRMNR